MGKNARPASLPIDMEGKVRTDDELETREKRKEAVAETRFLRAGGRIGRREALKGIMAIFTGAIFGKLTGALSLGSAYSAPIRKRIYIAPDDHTDYYWSGDGEAYREAFLQMLDYYLDLADATSNEPTEYQSRWNCDSSLWLWTYEKHRSEEEFRNLIERIRDGHITVPLNPAVLCYGAAPAEAILRGMYYCGHIERRHGLRFPLALAMENQTLPCGLVSLFRGSGAKYSWKGICGCASRVDTAWDREHEIYWWVGPDGSRILMKWNSMLAGNQCIGGYAEAYDTDWVIDYVDSNGAFTSRYPYDVIGVFGKGWDSLKTLTDEFVSVAKAKTNGSRQVIVSNQVDFFEDFEATHGSDLPSLACSFGNEWDTYPASMAEVTARVRRSAEKLRAAEALATLVSLRDPSFMHGRAKARDLAWMDFGLYWEHCWTADGSVSHQVRSKWQRKLAVEIESYVDKLYSEAAAALGAMIRKSPSNPRFYAFNPLSWARTDMVDLPYAGTGPVTVVDLSTGAEVPSQFVMVDSTRYLRILASHVPSIGYKVFEIRSGAGRRFSDAARISNHTMSNRFYRVSVAGRGAITSLIDRMRGDDEIAKAIGGRVMNDLGRGQGTIAVENVGPVSATLRAESLSPLSHTSRVTLIRNSRRIDIRNDISENFDGILTWGFGFDVSPPDVWHEEVGAVIRARLLPRGGAYSPRNARYDWLTLGHFAGISDGSIGVTLSNADCCFFQLGASSTDSLDSATPQISPLAGGQVDGPGLGIPSQGGDTHFLQRFALQTHDSFDPPQAMRFALEHQNPLVAAPVNGGDGYPESAFSFLQITNPSVLLWALKPAEEGIKRGIVARVWNLAHESADYAIASPLGPFSGARHLTHIETEIGKATLSGGAITDLCKKQQMKTFLFTMAGR